MTDIVFLDTETLGLDPFAPIWEFAAIRRYANGIEAQYHCFIDHDPAFWLTLRPGLPDAFRRDYESRYKASEAVTSHNAAEIVHTATNGAHVIGAVPSFDAVRLARLLDRTGWGAEPWHYHLIDVENLIVGYLRGLRADAIFPGPIDPPWSSDELSRAVGVDPELFARHTAMGDVQWVRAQYDAVMGGAEK